MQNIIKQAIQRIQDTGGKVEELEGSGYYFYRVYADAGDGWTYEVQYLGDSEGHLTVTQDTADYYSYYADKVIAY